MCIVQLKSKDLEINEAVILILFYQKYQLERPNVQTVVKLYIFTISGDISVHVSVKQNILFMNLQ